MQFIEEGVLFFCFLSGFIWNKWNLFIGGSYIKYSIGGIKLKKALTVILTMLIETGLLWIISIIFKWNIMEILFLGGVVIFAILWLFLYSSTQSNNQYNAGVKGETGQDSERIKLFQFRLSPITLGLILFIVMSLCLTVFYYYDYFI